MRGRAGGRGATVRNHTQTGSGPMFAVCGLGCRESRFVQLLPPLQFPAIQRTLHPSQTRSGASARRYKKTGASKREVLDALTGRRDQQSKCTQTCFLYINVCPIAFIVSVRLKERYRCRCLRLGVLVIFARKSSYAGVRFRRPGCRFADDNEVYQGWGVPGAARSGVPR